MKKLTVVFAAALLAVALVLSVGAAPLGEKWTSLEQYFSNENILSMDYDEFEATDNNTLKVTANSDEADWGCAGATINIGAAAKETLKLELYNDYIAAVGNGDSFAILIAPKDTKVLVGLTLGGQITYLADKGSAGILITFLANNDATKYNVAVWLADGTDIKGDYNTGYEFPADGKYSIEISPADGMLRVNGNEFAIDASMFNSIEDADLTIGQVAAGTASANVELFSINGKAANTYPDGADYVPSSSTPDDTSSAPADTSSQPSSTAVSSTASSTAQNSGCGNNAE